MLFLWVVWGVVCVGCMVWIVWLHLVFVNNTHTYMHIPQQHRLHACVWVSMLVCAALCECWSMVMRQKRCLIAQ